MGARHAAVRGDAGQWGRGALLRAATLGLRLLRLRGLGLRRFGLSSFRFRLRLLGLAAAAGEGLLDLLLVHKAVLVGIDLIEAGLEVLRGLLSA